MGGAVSVYSWPASTNCAWIPGASHETGRTWSAKEARWNAGWPCCVSRPRGWDLRRTAASWAVQSGASLAVVAASLGHADTRVTEQHYGHLSDDPVRRMLADNAGRLLATTGELGTIQAPPQSGPAGD